MHELSPTNHTREFAIPNAIQGFGAVETWTTRACDLALADALLSQYVGTDAQCSLPLIESWIFSMKDNGLYIHCPAWLDELAQLFKHIHGELIGPFILSYVMDELLQTLEAKRQITQDTVSFVRGLILIKYHHLTSKFH